MARLIYNDDFDIENHPITERVQAKADEIGALFNLPEAASGFYHKTSHGTILTFHRDLFNSEDSSLLKIARLGVREFRICGGGDLFNFHFGHDLTPNWEVSAQKQANKHTGENKMLNNKNIAKLRSYENRLENEHNDPEFIPQEECFGPGRCDKLTEPTPGTDTCSECGLEYGQNADETIEALQNRVAELEATIVGYQTMYPPKK